MIRNSDSVAVSSDCAEVGSCWFFSSCTLLLWTSTAQHHHIACTTVRYPVVTSPGRWRWCSSPSKTKPNLQPCDRPDDPNLGWFRAVFLLTKVECNLLCESRILLCEVRNIPWFQQNPRRCVREQQRTVPLDDPTPTRGSPWLTPSCSTDRCITRRCAVAETVSSESCQLIPCVFL